MADGKLTPRVLTRPLAASSLTVGVGVALYGLTAYAFLVIAARAMGPERYAGLSTLWAMVYLLAPGFFLPVEQETSRSLASGEAGGEGRAGRLGRTTAAFVALLLAGVALASGALDRHLFDGDRLLLGGLSLAILGYGAQHLVRGVLAGTGRFIAYAVVLSTEGFVRVGAALVLAIVGVTAAGPYGLVIGLAPMLSIVPALGGGTWQRIRLGGGRARSAARGSIGFLVASSLLAQFLALTSPIAVKLLAQPDEAAVAGRLLASLVLARVPLFLFQAVQPPLLARLSTLAGAGRMAEFRSSLLRATLGVGALGALTVLAAASIGPWLVGTLFGDRFVLDRVDLVLLAGGSAAYILAIVFVQALIAIGSYRTVALGWLLGSVAFVLVTALGTDLLARVEYGFLVGSLTAAGAMGGVIMVLDRRPPGEVQMPAPAPAILEP